MELSEIEKILKDALDLHEVHVKGEGSHFNIIAVSDAFNEMSRVKRASKRYMRLWLIKLQTAACMQLPSRRFQ